ncbi:MAG: NAD(+)/NADH kinase, partial [Proteobacteria bacterium]|nr:NAD(+)/NADH kinase [Pseudomonadota bacterium]
ALINPASGSVGPTTAAELDALFAELGLDHQVSELVSGQFEQTIRSAIDTDPDLVVVIGGDGTARTVAELCGPDGPIVAPLSGGTMNKLGRALYGPRPWHEALATALTHGEVRWVHGGEVGGRVFFCSAILGSGALWARAREAVRARDFNRAQREAQVAYRRAFETRLSYRCDTQEIGSGMAVGFICPMISRALDTDAGALEVALLDLHDTKAGIRLAMNYLLRDWREDPEVTVWRCVTGQVSSAAPSPGILDREFFRFGHEVETRIRPRAFRALAIPSDEPAVA